MVNVQNVGDDITCLQKVWRVKLVMQKSEHVNCAI